MATPATRKQKGHKRWANRPCHGCLKNEALAVARNLRVSPRKLNLLAQLIRGKGCERALAELQFSQKRIAHDVRKTLQSAIASTENNHQLDVDRLYVAEATVGKALVMKRFTPRARGRAGAYREGVLELASGAARTHGGRIMGQKVNPVGLRLGVNRTWDSRWFADDNYAGLLQEDLKIRNFSIARRQAFRASSSSVRRRRRGLPSIRRGRAW